MVAATDSSSFFRSSKGTASVAPYCLMLQGALEAAAPTHSCSHLTRCRSERAERLRLQKDTSSFSSNGVAPADVSGVAIVQAARTGPIPTVWRNAVDVLISSVRLNDDDFIGWVAVMLSTELPLDEVDHSPPRLSDRAANEYHRLQRYRFPAHRLCQRPLP